MIGFLGQDKPSIALKPLTEYDSEQIRTWRNDCLYALRTPYSLTAEQQENWYAGVVCDRDARSRYMGVYLGNTLIGYGGIENIEWENSRGEISLLIDPEKHGKGYGSLAAELFLYLGFNNLNLNSIYGEAYLCNPGYKFWERLVDKYKGVKGCLPETKYWAGSYYDSLHFTIRRKEYESFMLHSGKGGK